MSDVQAEANHDWIPAAPGTMEVARRGVQEGAADAREAATRTWAATSLFMSRFVYTACYTVSYGVVFPTTLLAQAIPTDNAAVRGLIDGAQAAIHKVDEMQGMSLDWNPSETTSELAPA